MIQTSHGPLEYAVLGEGLPLVVMHGSCGGVRQGLMMRCLFDTRRIRDHRAIASGLPGHTARNRAGDRAAGRPGGRDPGATYERARAAAGAVSGAKVMIIEGGSHGIFATHYQEVGAEIEAFLLSLKS